VFEFATALARRLELADSVQPRPQRPFHHNVI
jgi:hypothetical protein